MSWDSYIDNLIAQSKDASGECHADRAVIIGLDGSKWTTDGHANAFKITTTEAANIGRAFKSGDFTPFMSSGVHAEGVKYQFLREEDKKLVLAKKKGCGALTAQKSKTAVVIAHCPEGGQQGNCNKGVGVIAEYLESMGM
ncbi:profilin-like [Asterias amurensis]|uniref:profilin-like n=1 Tax=Asterias amurensis TaxID=7602 RepID=UPI003AB61A57